MAPSSAPWFTSCAVAAVSGLLALATGTASAPAAVPAVDVPDAPVAGAATGPTHPAQPRAARAAVAAHRSASATLRAGGRAFAPVLAPVGESRTAAQRSALYRATSSETVVGSTSGATGSRTTQLRETSLRTIRGSKKPAPSPSPTAAPVVTTSPTPTPTATATATPTVTSTPTPTATATATPTATVTAAPTATVTPTASATPTPTVTVTPTASPSPSPTATNPSGQSAPNSDLPGWKLAMSEDFNVTAPIGQFMTAYSKTIDSYKDGWVDTARVGTYMPSKVVSAHDGMMDYYLHTENGVHMVAAEMPKLPNGQYGQTYGRYSVRFKNDVIPGYASAWLLWPNSERWPDDGEIDFPEASLFGNKTINAFSHYASATGGQDWFGSSTVMTGAWHTATVEWAPGSVTFYLDGVKMGTSTKMTPSTAMHWVLQTETSYGTVPLDSTSGHVYIDWVAQWSKV